MSPAHKTNLRSPCFQGQGREGRGPSKADLLKRFDICLSRLCTTNPSTNGTNRCTDHLSAYRTHNQSTLDHRLDCLGTRTAARSRRSCRGIHYACHPAQHNEANRQAMEASNVPALLRMLHREPLLGMRERRRAIHEFPNAPWAFRPLEDMTRLQVLARSTRSRTARMERHCTIFPRPWH